MQPTAAPGAPPTGGSAAKPPTKNPLQPVWMVRFRGRHKGEVAIIANSVAEATARAIEVINDSYPMAQDKISETNIRSVERLITINMVLKS